MSALHSLLSKLKTPEAISVAKKMGWLGAGVVAGGTGKELVGLARDELSGSNPLKRAVLGEIDRVAKDPDRLLKRIEQATSMAANLKRLSRD